MEEQVIIQTDTAGKNLYESSLEFCEGYAAQLDQIHGWILEIDKYEQMEKVANSGQDFSIVRMLYQLQALFVIASADLSIIISQMYLCKIKLQHLFFNRQLNLCIYEAHNTYSGHKQFLRKLVNENYPDLMEEFEEIRLMEKQFVRDFKIKTTVMDIRNKVGGHIDKDFKAWHRTVSSLDGEQDGKMIIAFMSLFKQIFNLTTKLTQRQHQLFLDFSASTRASAENYLSKIQELMDEQNAKLPEGSKLDFNLQVIRDLMA